MAWKKHAENVKRSKSAAYDNYDASKFVSQYRKPLGNVSLNSGPVDSGAGGNANGSAHVRCRLGLDSSGLRS